MEQSRSLWITLPLILFGVASIASSIGIFVILSQNTEDCHLSLREFLFVFSGVLMLLSLPVVLVEAFCPNCLKNSCGLIVYTSFIAILIGALYLLMGWVIVLAIVLTLRPSGLLGERVADRA